MKRRALLRGAGVVVAGVALGLRATRARAGTESMLGAFYEAARADGKPVIVASVVGLTAEEMQYIQNPAWILYGRDRELAVRVRLANIYASEDQGAVRALTNDVPKVDSPSLAFVDGDPPRLIKAAKLDEREWRRGLESFLRDVVPLNVRWLESRVALLLRDRGPEVREIRWRVAQGQPIGDLGIRLAAVTALEAMRRKGRRGQDLLKELVGPIPV
jgi:hypothetical protein